MPKFKTKINITFVALSLCCNIVFANSSYIIADELKKASKTSGIDSKILYTIAKIESNFNPNIIAFVDSKKWNFSGPNITTTNLKYKNKYLIQIRGDTQSLRKIAEHLIVQGRHIDIGLMQINSINFKISEISRMFEIDYNIKKSIEILNICNKKHQTIPKTIECYNKGNAIKNYKDYYTKFLVSFRNDFGFYK